MLSETEIPFIPFTIMEQKLLNRKQVAEYFSVKPKTVSIWHMKGWLIPTIFLNGRPRYRSEDLDKMYKSISSKKTEVKNG